MSYDSSSSPSLRREEAASQRRQDFLRNALIIVGGIFILAALLLFSSNKSSAGKLMPPVVGSRLGEFSLTELGGKVVRLSDYSGKTVLLNAWATWCPPCRAEMPLLNQYYENHRQQGFMILALNAGDEKTQVSSFVNQTKLSFPILLDPDSRVTNSMRIHDFPTSILVGRDGKVKAIHIGMLTPDALESEITPHLSE